MGMVMESSATGVCVSVSLYLRTFFWSWFCHLLSPASPASPILTKKHDKTTWSSTKFKSMCKRTPIPLQSSNPCATWHLYHYKIQIHVQNDPSTKFKSRYTHTELSLYKIQIHVKTKPYKTKGQTKKTLHKIQAPSSYKNSFLKTTYFWHFWLTWIWIL